MQQFVHTLSALPLEVLEAERESLKAEVVRARQERKAVTGESGSDASATD